MISRFEPYWWPALLLGAPVAIDGVGKHDVDHLGAAPFGRHLHQSSRILANELTKLVGSRRLCQQRFGNLHVVGCDGLTQRGDISTIASGHISTASKQHLYHTNPTRIGRGGE